MKTLLKQKMKLKKQTFNQSNVIQRIQFQSQ